MKGFVLCVCVCMCVDRRKVCVRYIERVHCDLRGNGCINIPQIMYPSEIATIYHM